MHQIPDLIFLDYYLLFPFRQSWCRCLLMTTISTIVENFLTNGLLGQTLNSELTQTLDNSYAFKGKIYLYRLGNIKKIYIDGFKDIPVGQTTVIDTIPKDYLPIMSDYSWDKNNVSGQPYRIGLLRNGSLSIHVYTSNFSGENNTIFDEVYF